MINRGISKRPLFENPDEVRFFLARMVRQIRLGRIEVHAFCILATHFHLLVRSPIGQVSEAMRRMQNEYVRQFNRTHKRDGSLVRGRFFSRPVRSLHYRRVLVRYIDANPVRARIVSESGDYAYGSAAGYLARARMRWLTREWVETEAMALVKASAFTPAVYQRAFGSRGPKQAQELCELVEKRASSRADVDPFEDLAGLAPSQVRLWMERKARLADGNQLGLPICGRSSLERALEADRGLRGAWSVEDGRHSQAGGAAPRAALLHGLCGLSWSEIAEALGISVARARGLSKLHMRRMNEDADYSRRVLDITRAAIPI